VNNAARILPTVHHVILRLQTGPVSVPLMANATQGFVNPNNCSIPATFFTMEFNTDCQWVKSAWEAGNEIATHTMSHLAMPTGFTGGAGSIEAEITGARDYLIKKCSLPEGDVVGFRSPYLAHHPGYRQVLSNAGFLYDSTINEHWPMPTSPSGEQRLWPYVS
jgi:peptidoglycan/xylan/chitin deacetylase (PgdA/CDA1 family)